MAGVGHDPSEKIKKLTIINLFCEILNNFVVGLVIDKSKSSLIGAVAVTPYFII